MAKKTYRTHTLKGLQLLLNDEDGRRIREVLNGYLGAVCDRDRAVFVQRYFYAVPVKKIARKVGLRPVSVYKILERMRSELRAALENEDITV